MVTPLDRPIEVCSYNHPPIFLWKTILVNPTFFITIIYAYGETFWIKISYHIMLPFDNLLALIKHPFDHIDAATREDKM